MCRHGNGERGCVDMTMGSVCVDMARGEWVCIHGNGEIGCVNMARGELVCRHGKGIEGV